MAQSMKLHLLPALLLILMVQVQVQAQGARPRAGAPPAAADTTTTTTKCAAMSVTVEVANTGDKAGHDPVFEVAVRNACRCAVRGVSLRSEGFASSVPVDPRLFRRRDDGDYLVGDSRRIESGAEVRFRYAWDRAFRMTPVAVHDDCS